MKKIAVIDPFIVTPALSCFNRLTEQLAVPLQYHQPQINGLQTLNDFPVDAYIVLGSASHVYQDLPWHSPLGDFLLNALHQNKPVLGICFGHQLICHKLGAKVQFHSADESKHKGFREITLTTNAYGIEKGRKLNLAVSHAQVVTALPDQLEQIGVGLPCDLVRHKTLPFLGTQPHAEASDFFCQTEALLQNSTDVTKIQTDGMFLIRSFFHHYKIIDRL